MIEHAHLFSG